MFSENANIGGTMLWYYSICHREVWLMARGIEPEQENENLLMGRLIDQNSYAREKHQIVFGDNKFDFMQGKGGTLIVAEIKKSSRAEKASALQLAHYLYELEKAGISASGVLVYPKEKKRTEIQLTDLLKAELNHAYAAIAEISRAEKPPAPVLCKFCAKCAYADYCWG